jgi:hypothetical protein
VEKIIYGLGRAEGEGEMLRRTAVVLIALLASSAAESNYVTFQTWLTMPEPVRDAYIAGAYDSLENVGEDTEQMRRTRTHYANCLYTAKMTSIQLAANVLNFAKDKPELQTGLVQRALVNYLIAACGEPPTK